MHSYRHSVHTDLNTDMHTVHKSVVYRIQYIRMQNKAILNGLSSKSKTRIAHYISFHLITVHGIFLYCITSHHMAFTTYSTVDTYSTCISLYLQYIQYIQYIRLQYTYMDTYSTYVQHVHIQ